jgi:hemerythrin superfamily protein
MTKTLKETVTNIKDGIIGKAKELKNGLENNIKKSVSNVDKLNTDIYSYLKKDHKKVASLMESLLATNKKSEREKIFEEISNELLLHAKTEKATFYKALENPKATHERIEEAEHEHKEIEKYIKKLSSVEFNSEEWIEQFGEFKHSVSHHVEEEEGMIFEKAKKILSSKRAHELAAEMDKLKHSSKYNKQVEL